MAKRVEGKFTQIVYANDEYYRVGAELKVDLGDTLVVEPGYMNSIGFEFTVADAIFDNTFENAEYAGKADLWVIDKVDTSHYKAHIEAQARREWVVERLEEKKKDIELQQIYAFLAEKDEEAKSLIEELDSLQKL